MQSMSFRPVLVVLALAIAFARIPCAQATPLAEGGALALPPGIPAPPAQALPAMPGLPLRALPAPPPQGLRLLSPAEREAIRRLSEEQRDYLLRHPGLPPRYLPPAFRLSPAERRLLRDQIREEDAFRIGRLGHRHP